MHGAPSLLRRRRRLGFLVSVNHFLAIKMRYCVIRDMHFSSQGRPSSELKARRSGQG